VKQTAIIYFKLEEQLWEEENYQSAFSEMPEAIARRIENYTDLMDRQLRIRGKLLLKEILKDFLLDHSVGLEHIRYSATNRPNLYPDVDFSTAHSGHLVICGGLTKGRIGIDTEKIATPELKAFESFFSPGEWRQINNSDDPVKEFYILWTRKEALFKATGSGILGNFSELDVRDTRISLGGTTYYFTRLFIHPDFITHLATDLPELTIVLKTI